VQPGFGGTHDALIPGEHSPPSGPRGSGPSGHTPPDHWRGSGERIESLLASLTAHGPMVAERSERLVSEVVDLYGAGLERVLALVARFDDRLVAELTRDELVASLLLVHGLHPHDVETRIQTALEQVRPYLGSHGGDVELIEFVDGVVRLKFQGACKSCPSSAVTLELAVEEAVRAAAPETVSIEVVTPAPTAAGNGVIPAESLFHRVHTEPVHGHGAQWVAVPELVDLEDGEVGGFTVGGLALLVCRLGPDVFAFADHCPVCEGSLAGAVLHRIAGQRAGNAALRCPRCREHFDVRGAGAALDHTGQHLSPLPVLVSDGELTVAIPAGQELAVAP
jgi:Fe-S cluster biogenesis protein NfuA/nitrite reductase/ring-hydroxylating ferredoxin subunit